MKTDHFPCKDMPKSPHFECDLDTVSNIHTQFEVAQENMTGSFTCQTFYKNRKVGIFAMLAGWTNTEHYSYID